MLIKEKIVDDMSARWINPSIYNVREWLDTL